MTKKEKILSQELVEIPPRKVKNVIPELRLKLVAFVLLLSEFVRSLGSNLYTISLPLIAQEMTQSAILTGVAIGIFGLVQSFTQYPLGKFSDKFGRRGVLLVSAVVYAVGAILVGFAQNITQFILFRGIQAIGAVMSVLQACLSDIFPPTDGAPPSPGFPLFLSLVWFLRFPSAARRRVVWVADAILF